MIGGLALRLWANQTLGQFYTSTLRIAERQRIIRQGPYKVLRHPGYGGLLLTWAGAGLATENWIAATIIILVMFISYHYRIISEEAMLLTAFGEQLSIHLGQQVDVDTERDIRNAAQLAAHRIEFLTWMAPRSERAKKTISAPHTGIR